ncbi:MAG: Crp/Fnr family transcriptional regulator [Proteobacteria bacterium]|nr:Crp/Fnr family transcriptional regulator [Pseudomonadota bacterium]MBU4384300.1 Crp/Fnr family transcriptional regulator [Pseudomonadota bacterium]MBU4604020.1 Crp/Fnr family transcriptional regulator [Pseudomonadota bacterium]MCG2764118.1 Crp/Fnr family transcriptional regulator [Desulfarculaceae bacterium]
MSSCLCEQLAEGQMDLSPVCLGSLWVFANLSPSEMQALAQAAQRRRYKKGETIFAQGEPARRMFLLKAGRVKLCKVTAEGNELILDLRGGGDFLGEGMLTSEEEFPLSAVCLEETLTCGFSREGFESLVLGHPNIGLQVIRNLSRRIDSLTQRVGSMSATHLEERLHQVLWQVAREHGRPAGVGRELAMPFTHEELSFLVGAHRVSITRAMKALREAGRVVQRGKSLVVAPA